MTFTEAEQFCAEKQAGATLAAVPDYADLAKSITFDTDLIWIALRSTPDQQGNLHWLNWSGAPVEKTHWNAVIYSEPNGPVNGPNNDCVMLNGLKSLDMFTVGEWGDFDCSYESRFLCAVRA